MSLYVSVCMFLMWCFELKVNIDGAETELQTHSRKRVGRQLPAHTAHTQAPAAHQNSPPIIFRLEILLLNHPTSPINRILSTIRRQPSRWVRNNTESPKAYVCEWMRLGKPSLSANHGIQRSWLRAASVAGESVSSLTRVAPVAAPNTLSAQSSGQMSIPDREADGVFHVYRYRSAQAPRAEHAPQGSQERQCVPQAPGEALPLPGP